jgi:hypothetical protein
VIGFQKDMIVILMSWQPKITIKHGCLLLLLKKSTFFFDSVSKIEEKFDLDTNRIWGKCSISTEKMNEFGFYFLQDIKARWVFGNEQLNFGNINFDNFTFFVDVNSGPFWYYALDETRMIVYFFSESREYYSRHYISDRIWL